jgi:hypothetical protein
VYVSAAVKLMPNAQITLRSDRNGTETSALSYSVQDQLHFVRVFSGGPSGEMTIIDDKNMAGAPLLGMPDYWRRCPADDLVKCDDIARKIADRLTSQFGDSAPPTLPQSAVDFVKP